MNQIKYNKNNDTQTLWGSLLPQQFHSLFGLQSSNTPIWCIHRAQQTTCLLSNDKWKSMASRKIFKCIHYSLLISFLFLHRSQTVNYILCGYNIRDSILYLVYYVITSRQVWVVACIVQKCLEHNFYLTGEFSQNLLIPVNIHHNVTSHDHDADHICIMLCRH
jgi:hypothetical protein